MADAPNNPPAFPLHPGIDPDWQGNLSVGMTLRDWFAGQALAGMMAHSGAVGESSTLEIISGAAFALADAMLAERQRGQS